MTKQQNGKAYELEERTFQFAAAVRLVLANSSLPPVCWSDSEQLLRSSGSTAANYIEANDSISQKDKIYRLKIARKEANESNLWARLLQTTLPEPLKEQMPDLIKESEELTRILSAILLKVSQHPA